MYDAITGTLVRLSKEGVSIETHGLAYRILIPLRTYTQLPPLGSSVRLYLAFIVREQSHALYGFLQEEERHLFERLLNVTGIGPKIALGLIGHLECPQLIDALAAKDIATLSRVPGVGKKTAERLVVELKDLAADTRFLPMHDIGPLSLFQDAISALVHLGYTQSTAQKAVKKSMGEQPNQEAHDLATLIAASLKHL